MVCLLNLEVDLFPTVRPDTNKITRGVPIRENGGIQPKTSGSGGKGRETARHGMAEFTNSWCEAPG
jgi:hypothetical protein